MPRYRHWTDILVLPEDLISFAWSAPMRELAAKVGISDVGLRKQFVGYGVHLPPQGYWNKLHAGKSTPTLPLPRPRQPGGIGRLKVDQRFEGLVSIAEPISSQGPFASEDVPESLDDLYTQELAAIGQISVPRSLDRPHVGLVNLLAKEESRRKKLEDKGWGAEPLFDSPVARRQLRIFNAIGLALSRRHHNCFVSERDGEIRGHITIGDTSVTLAIAILGKDPRRQPWQPLALGLPGATPLALRFSPSHDGRAEKTWQDDKNGSLEEKMQAIVAGLIVGGEARFRSSLRENEEWQQQLRIQREKERLRQLEEANLERLQSLLKSGDLLRQANEIRNVVQSVRRAMTSSRSDIDLHALEAWEAWALGEADKLDPVLSGQFMSHLIEPTLED